MTTDPNHSDEYALVHCEDCLPVFAEAGLTAWLSVRYYESMQPGVMRLMRKGSAFALKTWSYDPDTDSVTEVTE